VAYNQFNGLTKKRAELLLRIVVGSGAPRTDEEQWELDEMVKDLKRHR
jgi:hypothetical protein